MSPSAKNRFLFAGLMVLVVAGLGEAPLIIGERREFAAVRARTAARNAEIAALRESCEATQRELAKAEGQLAALPPRPVADEKADSSVTAKREAWLARIRALKRVFAEQPDQRIPEMKLLEDSDWLQATQFPIETEGQLRLALAEVREAARVRFRPLIMAALRKYETASNHRLPDSVLTLALYFDSPVDPAMLQQYELVEQRPTIFAGTPYTLAFRTRAPIDDFYEYHSTFSAAGSGSWGMDPTSTVDDFRARDQQARLAYGRDHLVSPPPSIRELAPYFVPPLPAEFVERYAAFLDEMDIPH